ncbi:prepilin peptidase [Sphingomonas oligophenolica]|uniref:Prepilin leader peptidase/N-methyltransferase n=1 Tax=Sphingomonas oligophenolica TaxID=301154 RepID=A0A502CJI4_9SPHN|nr:A24 family peptidase [Sphingomonas oligophenolica]TPG12804.1 prepilin peptidase [Sphingomonas oligophenolica]
MCDALAWPIGLAVLGVIVGSFVAALVIRWPQGQSVLRGRSRCDACDRTLAPRDLVPLLSAAVLRGRCRTCGARIDPRHGQIELTALAIGAAAGIAVAGPVAIAGAGFGWMLLALAALDVEALWLPDRLTVPLALAGVLTGAIGVHPMVVDRLIGGAAGFASLWLIALAYRSIRGRDGMGGGDPKLFAAIGLWLGWQLLPAVLLIASLVGLALVLVDRVRGKPVARDTALPLGALLAIAAYPAWLAMIGLGS